MTFYFTIYILISIGGLLVFSTSCRYETALSGEQAEYRMKRRYRMLYGIFCFTLLFLSCFRYGIGSDYHLYERGYNGTAGWWEVVDLRGGFGWLVKTFNSFQIPYQVFIACFAVVSLGITFRLIKIYSWNPVFSLAVLVGMSYYSFSLNSFRQFTAIVLLIFAIHLNTCGKKRNYLQLKTLLVILAAIAIHQTAFFAAVILIALFFWQPKTKTVYLLSVAGVFIFGATRIGLQYINKLITLLVSLAGYYSNYLKYRNHAEQYYRLYSRGTSLFNTVMLIPSFYLTYRIVKDYNAGEFKTGKFSYMMIKLYFVYQFFLCMNMSSEMIDRFTFYFSFPVIFVYPAFVKYAHSRWNKRSAAVIIIFLTLAVGYMFTRYLRINAYSIIPYTSIFWKER